MKNKFAAALALSLGLLSANAAMADNTVWGALIGGGAGAAVGSSIHGRNGAIVGGALGAAAGAAIGSQQYRYQTQAGYYSPPPVYYTPQPAYYSPQVYYSPPVRIVQQPVYYVQDGYGRGYRGHHNNHDRGRHGNNHGYGGRHY